MTILYDKRGLSRIEVFCIVGICLIAVFAIYKGFVYYYSSMARGNDKLKVNSAQSVAEVNLLTTGCVVSECESIPGETCSHADKDGYTTGYYDTVSKKIFVDRLPGYNEYREMKIGDEVYEGDRNTMIIKVRGGIDKVYYSWVEGDNR